MPDSVTPGLPPDEERFKRVCEAAQHKVTPGEAPDIRDWLLALIEQEPDMLGTLRPDIQWQSLKAALRRTRASAGTKLPLPMAEAIQRSNALAAAQGRKPASAADLAQVVLELGSALVSVARAAPPAAPGPPAAMRPLGEQPTRSRTVQPRHDALAAFATNLVQRATEGKLAPAVGRDTEIDLVIETLCRSTKRNPVLVGPAGVGKTAIVEGLAVRIASGAVPQHMRDWQVYGLQPSTLVAGIHGGGEYHQRIKDVIREAEDPNVVLFIDELHSVMAYGGPGGDLATLLKPALSRGDLACIGATTDDEFRRIIGDDPALERRFQPLRIQEMSVPATLEVLMALRNRLTQSRQVEVPDVVLGRLLTIADERMPNRHFPDKALDLLEQVVANVVASGARLATIEAADRVAERMLGVPLAVSDCLVQLENELLDQGLLDEEATADLIAKLRLSVIGLDVHFERPNAMILLRGRAASISHDLAALIAETLMGGRQRVVTIDFGRLTRHYDITSLVGAGPSYVGYGDRAPIHQLVQMPWSVMVCTNVDGCHPSIGMTFRNALQSGVITDGAGKEIYLSDAVVIMTEATAVPAEAASPNSRIGLRGSQTPGHADDDRPVGLSDGMWAALCDVVVDRPAQVQGPGLERWINRQVLSGIASRYAKRGVHIEWDQTLAEWAVRKSPPPQSRDRTREMLEECIGKLLIGLLPDSGTRPVRVYADQSGPRVEELELEETETAPRCTDAAQPN